MTLVEVHEKLLAAAIPLARAKFPGYASDWVYRQIGEMIVEEELRRMAFDAAQGLPGDWLPGDWPTRDDLHQRIEADLAEHIRRQLWDDDLAVNVLLLFGDPAARKPAGVLSAPRPLRPAGRPLRPHPEAP